MLTLDLNGNYFALESGFSVRMRWANPACFMSEIPGDSGIGIDLPINEVNRGILGNPERFDKLTVGASAKFPGCTLKYSGAILMEGVLVVQGTGDSYSCWLQSNLGNMGDEQKDRTIKELAWKTDQTFVDVPFATQDDAKEDYGTTTFHNKGFWEGIGKETTITKTTTAWDAIHGKEQEVEQTRTVKSILHEDNFGFRVNDKDGSGLNKSGEGAVVSPQLFLQYVIKETLRLNGWYINIDEMYNPATYWITFLNNLKVYNNFNIMSLLYTTIERSIAYWDYDKNEDVVTSVYETQITSWGIGTFNYSDLLPAVSVKDFFLGIQNSLNYVFRFRNDGKVDIVDRNNITAMTPINLNNYFMGKWQISEQKNVRLKFTPEYDKDDSRYSDKYEDLTDRYADFEASVANKAALEALVSPEIGELRMVTDENKIYEYKFKVVSSVDANGREEEIDAIGWEFISSGPQPYIYSPAGADGKEMEEIKTAVSTLQYDPDLAMYAAIQKGNLAQLRSAWNGFGLRLLNNNELLNPVPLYWEGSNGLFAQRWKAWATFWANRVPVTGEFELAVNELIYVAENITSKFSIREGEFVIEEMETEFSLNRVGRTTIKGFKI